MFLFVFCHETDLDLLQPHLGLIRATICTIDITMHTIFFSAFRVKWTGHLDLISNMHTGRVVKYK